MLSQLGMILQLIASELGLALGPQISQAPIIALILLGAATLVPLLAWFAGILFRASTRSDHHPPQEPREVAPSGLRLPGAPGTPGGALVRAPSVVVHAHA